MLLSGLENPIHLLIILVVALVVLGPKRLPEAGRALGAGIRNFRSSLAGEDSPRSQDASLASAAREQPAPAGEGAATRVAQAERPTAPGDHAEGSSPTAG